MVEGAKAALEIEGQAAVARTMLRGAATRIERLRISLGDNTASAKPRRPD
jgi:hypothetical protein